MNGVNPQISEAFSQYVRTGRKPGSAEAKRYVRLLKNSIYSPSVLKRASAAFVPVQQSFLAEGAYIASKRWALDWSYPEERFHTADDFRKAQALNCLIYLAEHGRLERLRECQRCRRWLYARFSHQRFCSTKCQQAYYWASPEWKAHRKQWMRDYRSLKASGKVK
jgi:hypothetical protein